MTTTTTATVWNKTYTRDELVDMIAHTEQENESWGESDDRVTFLNAARTALGNLDAAADAVQWEVVRNEYPVPCEHPLCALLHKRFHEGTEYSDEVVQFANGTERVVRVRGIHERTAREWIILRNGERVGSAHDTKRDAQRELDTFHPTF